MLSYYPLQYYTPERIQEAVMIVNKAVLKRYKITLDQFHTVLMHGSNMSQLKYPIVDEYGLSYHDSEGYYMAQRVDDMRVKKRISEDSKIRRQSKKTAYEFEKLLDTNPENRITFMRNAIREKFNGSKWRNEMLLETAGREIIEFTYWNDQFFGISHDTRTGRNILGKLLMEYRDDLLAELGTYE